MKPVNRTVLTTAAVGAALLLAGCERPPMESVQRGFRGTAMEVVYNPRTLERVVERNRLPDVVPAVPPGGPTAREVYKNVQVLGDLSVGEFTRVMVAITNWVSPEQGCNYCHNPANLAEDSVPQKVIARSMLRMTRDINANWKQHVGNTGVTCFTCHRGQPEPQYTWFSQPMPAAPTLGNRYGQNIASRSVNLSSLPEDPFTPYLLRSDQIRNLGTTALPTGHVASIQHTEWTYALMVHMSEGLGVNCTYCHNSRSFAEWAQSPPQRTTAWHGIRMVRSINNAFMVPLTPVFPQSSLGPHGDVAKVNCATCHQGAYKPLLGQSVLKDYPELMRGAIPGPGAAAEAAPQQAAARR